MAKYDNVPDFVVDIAETIRTATHTTDKINPQNFSNKIAAMIGTPIKLSTDEDMANALTQENVGKVVMFTGSSDTYENGVVYIVREV